VSGADTPHVVLASASVSRARILRDAGLEFDVVPAHVDEDAVKAALKAEGATAIDAAETLAEMKAVKVSQQRPQALVIGADSILDLNGEWFDKPADADHAKAHLMTLRGQSHEVATAVVVALGGRRIWHYRDRPVLKMRRFSDAFLDAYLAEVGEAVMSSVGTYHLEGRGAQLFESIEGDFFSILGLPLIPLLGFLREHNAVLP
jgi:septum formation protein